MSLADMGLWRNGKRSRLISGRFRVQIPGGPPRCGSWERCETLARAGSIPAAPNTMGTDAGAL